jgi:hypothetical protein
VSGQRTAVDHLITFKGFCNTLENYGGGGIMVVVAARYKIDKC